MFDSSHRNIVDGIDAILEDLPFIFAWREPNHDLETLELQLLQLRRSQMDKALSEIMRADGRIGSYLQDSLAQLPESYVWRFISAPETACRATSCPDDVRNIAFFDGALTAEHRLNGSGQRTGACWTALGDFYFAADEETARRGASAQDGARHPDVAAPRISDAIPMDLISPNAQFVNSMSKSLFEPYTPEEQAGLYESLNEAFRRISLVEPAIAQLIRRFVRVIVCRKESSRLNRMGSSSTPSHIGRILLRNGHMMDIGTLADALVHETIHAVMFSIECFHPLISSSVEISLASPWSGNSLPLWIYLQACFVWYGLTGFWHAAARGDVFPSHIAKRHLEKAMSGFRGKNPAARMRRYPDLISSTVLEVACSLQGQLQTAGHLN